MGFSCLHYDFDGLSCILEWSCYEMCDFCYLNFFGQWRGVEVITPCRGIRHGHGDPLSPFLSVCGRIGALIKKSNIENDLQSSW